MKSPAFILSLVGCLILAGMAYKGLDVSMAIVTLIGAYIASQGAQAASHVYCGSEDV